MMSRIIRAMGRHLLNRAKAFLPEVAQTAQVKAAQGASELANTLFTGQGYMPWPGSPQPTVNQQATRNADVQEATAKIMQERAAPAIQAPAPKIEPQRSNYATPDASRRAQFQNKDQSQGIER
jgi:hypothetical protein